MNFNSFQINPLVLPGEGSIVCMNASSWPLMVLNIQVTMFCEVSKKTKKIWPEIDTKSNNFLGSHNQFK